MDRISLADITKKPTKFRRASSSQLSPNAHPTIEDLSESLTFSPGDGRIWLNDQRMILLHTASFGALRRELLDTLGLEKARELLRRVGYSSGARDAELVRRRWPDGDPASAFAGGPRLHALEGVVKVTTVKFDFDVDRGTFYGEFLWNDSMEAAEQVAAQGIGSTPACWMQIGYASGYASAFMGKSIIYRELQCSATGGACCHIVGRPADAWADGETDVDHFRTRAPLRTCASQPVFPLEAMDGEPVVLGLSSAFRAALHMLERVAPTDTAVLLLGETGAGKELFARALHRISPRARAPFVAVNCAAIPDSLVEAELFGVEKGAYTGAHTSRPGRFERASGGTLFLDEINSLSYSAQGKVLRALQEGIIERVGGTKPVVVNMRVVSASNVDLHTEVVAGRFRSDLYYRLNVYPVMLPALRDRRDDIPLLMEHFLRVYAAKHAREITGFSSRAIEALLNYDYPGNIRELQNLIERGVISAESGGAIDIFHMVRSSETLGPAAIKLKGLELVKPNEGLPKANSASEPLGSHSGDADVHLLAKTLLAAGFSIETLEKEVYRISIDAWRGNIAGAAKSLGLSRPTLEYRLKKHGLTFDAPG